MTDVENTSAREPISHLAGLLGGSDDYILGMEAAGQRQLVNSDVLPAEATGREYGSDGWPLLIEMGFVKGDPVPGDALFVNATLPEGWTRQAADGGAYWSYLIDDRGVRRVSVFYKAAFYDRRASMRVIYAGRELAYNVIYADSPIALPGQWPALTDAEKDSFRCGVAEYLDDAERYPDIYDRAERARALAALAAA